MKSIDGLTKIVLIVEYDGTNYYGFQFQASQPTVQAEIEEALFKLTGEKRRIVAASRTDTGVHARGQVVGFRTASNLPVETFVKALNYYLPKDIAVKSAHRVADSFNVQKDAVSREYRYYILNSRTRSPLKRYYAYLVPGDLNLEEMNRACQALVGERDFASFVTDYDGVRSTIRQVYRAEVRRRNELVIFDMAAKSFLPHQVRNTVGALLEVGLGRMTLDEFNKIMEAKRPGLAGPAAPAHGLCLLRVNYQLPF
ncbi:MAG: tRNA pseudouridine(38-40) synthase TruA [Dehalococcoidia bacterium]|nr:tRNA pseudouridine(38-40) synthase TruA [Dehalococcoidia bacterium]